MGQRVFDKADFYIRRGDRKRLRRLLNKRPRLLESDDSLLLFTAIWSRPSLVRWLLDRGVPADNRMGSGSNTPLMQAAADGDTTLMRMLMEFGADIEATNECNERPLGLHAHGNNWMRRVCYSNEMLTPTRSKIRTERTLTGLNLANKMNW